MNELALWVIFLGIVGVLSIICYIAHRFFPEQDDNVCAISFIIAVLYWVLAFYLYKGV